MTKLKIIKLTNFALNLPKNGILILIKIYQKTLSPDHGPLRLLFPHGFCRFNPSCSRYGYEVIDKKGVIRGVPLAIWRILRCNPWNPGGNDPVK